MSDGSSPEEYWESIVGRSTSEILSQMESMAVDILNKEHARVEPLVLKFLSDEDNLEYFRHLIGECLDMYIKAKYNRNLNAGKTCNKFETRDLLISALSAIESVNNDDIEHLNRFKGENSDYYESEIITPLEDAILFFHDRAKSPPGRRPHEDLELPLDVLMSALEFALGRRFRRNYKIEKGSDDFVHSDAKFLAVTLKEMDPSITSEMVKTVLKSYPARRSLNVKIPRTDLE
ncbi:hypothetical protein [Rhizobium leguminosarum]|uniref:hypothetical protein n=1 Tax=Rhizobium leguminosarum TaxID=384 RepID=UPI003F94A7AC